jgi:hypothetical protein
MQDRVLSSYVWYVDRTILELPVDIVNRGSTDKKTQVKGSVLLCLLAIALQLLCEVRFFSFSLSRSDAWRGII